MKLTKTKLKQIIKEELESLSERKLPPKEDPELVTQWENIKPELEQLAVTFKESSTGPHYTMANDVKMFLKKTESGMRIISYGELERVSSFMHREPVSSWHGTKSAPTGHYISEGILEGKLYDLTKETSVDYPEAYKAYKDSIGKIRAQSINLSDTDSYYYLLLLKEWLNFNVID